MIIITSYNRNSRVIIVTVVLHIMGLYLIVKEEVMIIITSYNRNSRLLKYCT